MNDNLTIPGVFADIANAIREKNGETNKILPENMPAKIRAITTGATIKTTDGWEGTPVPSSGIVEKIYYNKELSVEEVVAIFDTIDMLDFEDGYSTTAFIFNEVQIDDEYYINGILLDKKHDNTGVSYHLVGIIDNYEFTIFQSGPYFVDSFQGWNPDMLNEAPVGYENKLDEIVLMTGMTIENEKVSSVISATPFELIKGEVITLEGEYDGNPVVNNDYAKITKPIVVPNTGYVGKVYFNNKLTIEETRDILSELEYVNGSDGDYYYYILRSENSNVQIVTGRDAEGKPSKEFWITCVKDGNITAIPFHQFDSFQEQLGYIGWDPNTDYFTFGDTALSEFTNSDGNLVQVGHMNDKLINVFSTTPFEGFDKDANETLEVDLRQYIENQQIPLKLKMNVKKGGISVKADGGWVGSPIPDNGYANRVYFNREYPAQEVVQLITDIVTEINPSTSILDMENEIYPILVNDHTVLCLSVNKGVFGLFALSDDEIDIIFVYGANEEKNTEIYNQFSCIGWFPTTEYYPGYLEINDYIIDMRSYLGDTYSVWRDAVDRISCIISTTPFVRDKAQEVKMEGTYDGSTLVVDRLSEGSMEDIPVPNTGYIDKVYFNTSMSNEEVINMLKGLTYVDLGYGVPMCPLLANESLDKIFFATTDNGLGWHIAYTTSLSTDDMILIFNSYGTEPAPEPEWPTCWNPDINYDEIGVINGNVLSNFSGFDIGTDNDKLSSIFYTTSLVGANTIDLLPYIEKNKMPLSIKLADNIVDEPTTVLTGWIGVTVPGTYTWDSSSIYYNDNLTIEETDKILSQLTYGDYLGTGEQIYIYLCVYYYSSPEDKSYLHIKKLSDGYVITSGYYEEWVIYNSSPSSQETIGFIGWNPDKEPRLGFDYKNSSTNFDFPVAQENDKISSVISLRRFRADKFQLEGEYTGITIDVTKNTTIDVRSLIETYGEIPLYININVNPDAEDDIDWEYPVQNGDELTITQAYSLTQQDNTLEVE